MTGNISDLHLSLIILLGLVLFETLIQVVAQLELRKLSSLILRTGFQPKAMAEKLITHYQLALDFTANPDLKTTEVIVSSNATIETHPDVLYKNRVKHHLLLLKTLEEFIGRNFVKQVVSIANYIVSILILCTGFALLIPDLDSEDFLRIITLLFFINAILTIFNMSIRAKRSNQMIETIDMKFSLYDEDINILRRTYFYQHLTTSTSLGRIIFNSISFLIPSKLRGYFRF